MISKVVHLDVTLGLWEYQYFRLGIKTGSKQIKWVYMIGITVSNVNRIIKLAPKINTFFRHYSKKDTARAYIGKIKE